MTDRDPNDLTAENEKLRQQLALLTEERDTFRRAFLDQLARTEPGFTTEQLETAVPTGPWFDEFLTRLEAGDPKAMDSVPGSTNG